MPKPPLTRRHFLHRAGGASLGVAAVNPWAQPGLAADVDAATAAARDAALAERVSDAAIERRKARVVRTFAADPSFGIKKGNPRHQHAIVGARLSLDPNDAEALDSARRAPLLVCGSAG